MARRTDAVTAEPEDNELMSRYPREVRNARIKCIDCNAPVVRTADGRYVCVECGGSPLERHADVASVD
ncbi:hypothetical protein ACFQKF_03625 [Halalkalicoccus sp. GCM10025322]|uniref:hypothetical protein n=2 Tax=Halalkalicoccus TaxID=332246 RepID=UPI002F9646E7